MHFFGWLGFSNFHVRQTFVKQPFESKRAVASCKTPGSNAENRIQRCKGTPESLNLMILMVTMVTMFFFFSDSYIWMDFCCHAMRWILGTMLAFFSVAFLVAFGVFAGEKKQRRKSWSGWIEALSFVSSWRQETGDYQWPLDYWCFFLVIPKRKDHDNLTFNCFLCWVMSPLRAWFRHA